MRKLLIVPIVFVLAAGGCQQGRQSLRRMEVWKQHTFFSPTAPSTADPANPPLVPLPPVMEQPTAVSAEYGPLPDAVDNGPVLFPEGPAFSAEEVNGVLEQP